MRYYKLIENGYLTAIGTGCGGVEITEEEYNEILSLIQTKPTAEKGFDYWMKEDKSWELVEIPVVEPTDTDYDISGEELLDMIEGVL
jgi:hypothetical protein